MTRSSKTSRPATAPKNLTTPRDASRVQGQTAKLDGGKPAPWVGRLQTAAIKNFGKPGSK